MQPNLHRLIIITITSTIWYIREAGEGRSEQKKTLQAVQQKVRMRNGNTERIDQHVCYLLAFSRRQLWRRLDLTLQLCNQALRSLKHFRNDQILWHLSLSLKCLKLSKSFSFLLTFVEKILMFHRNEERQLHCAKWHPMVSTVQHTSR